MPASVLRKESVKVWYEVECNHGMRHSTCGSAAAAIDKANSLNADPSKQKVRGDGTTCTPFVVSRFSLTSVLTGDVVVGTTDLQLLSDRMDELLPSEPGDKATSETGEHMRDLSEFQDKVPDLAPGEDEILNVIQLRRAAGVDGELPAEFTTKFDELVALAESLYGEGCITVVTQITTSDAVVSEVEVTTGG